MLPDPLFTPHIDPCRRSYAISLDDEGVATKSYGESVFELLLLRE